MISINRINKFFNKGKSNEIHVINDVELSLPESGMVAIFGKSGCGKTTLLNVIGGLDSFESGSLTIEGADIRKNTDELRNKYIGYIFQNYNLNKEETCYDNVADALRLCGMSDGEEMNERVIAALTNVGMEKYVKRTPDTLSGGQQQRIAIARAIVKNPRIILADEPTGNLDEANTVMIMDLLKQISKDHLVILVTHEAELVDYYCDTVIELHDGRVISTKTNEAAQGYTARDKNHIFLGELTRDELGDTNAQIEYYGDTPDEPIRLKIVNHGGKTYLKVETAGIQILDSYSEVKLKEGVYTQTEKVNDISRGIDMSKLPPVNGKRYGKLFSIKSSLKSGYTANFSKNKRGITLLKTCMIMFAVVLVFMSSAFGTSISAFINARSSYNHNTFYVYTPDGEISSKLNNAVGANDTGIDYVVLYRGSFPQDKKIKFLTGNFETFSQYSGDGYETNAVFLSTAIADKLELVVGKKDNLSNEEILISTTLAKELLKNSTLGYITEYGDLIGLISTSVSIGGKNIRIAGIVSSDEAAVYLGDIAMAKYVVLPSNLQVALDIELDYEVEEGKTILYHTYDSVDANGNTIKYPKVGETVKINGKTLEVIQVLRHYTNYRDWLVGNNIKKLEWQEYCQSKYPEMNIDDAYQAYYSEWVVYFNSHIKDFLKNYRSFDPYDIYVWLATEKNLDIAIYTYAGELADTYRAVCEYQKKHGVYPTAEQLFEFSKTLPELHATLDEIRISYEEEFYNIYDYNNGGNQLYNNTYIVDENDYISFSKQKGETSPTAYPPYYYFEKGEIAVDIAYSKEEVVYDSVVMTDNNMYTLVHSTNPSLTAEWIKQNGMDTTETPYDYIKPVVTPDTIFESIIAENIETMIGGFVAMGVVLAILSICMYFIMRSSLMNRVKEIGIYRAIGVSKKNLILKFLIEAAVLTLFTVFIGYIIASIFISACLNASPLVEEILYYPLWVALADLVIIVGLCLACGVLPITQLLKKTPSAILAKYDI